MSTLVAPELSVPPTEGELPLWGEEPTLEDRISAAWDALLAGEPVTCPACGGVMQPRWSAGSGVVGGRCTDCGSELD